MVSVELRDITVRYATRDGAQAGVRNISLSVGPGQFVALVGRSGAGKTTILNAIAGITQTAGITIHPSNARQHIGYAFQTPRLLPWRTIHDNVALPLLLRLRNQREVATERVENVLAMFDIGKLAKRYPSECSEGERARAGCARAFVIEPQLLLLDEPFSHVDQINATTLRQRVLELWQRQRFTTILVTHDIREAIEMADRVVVVAPSGIIEIEIQNSRPRVIEDGSLQNVYERIKDALRE